MILMRNRYQILTKKKNRKGSALKKKGRIKKEKYIEMAPNQHKAAVLTKSRMSLEVKDVSTHSIGADEVLIKNTATAINPIDWKIRDFGILVDSYPTILGSDAAGEVVQIGEAVSNIRVGDRVFYQGILNTLDHSTFQQYTKLSADLVCLTPSNINDDEAASVALCSIAAIVGLYNHTGFNLKPAPWEKGGDQTGKGKAIVILGGSSSVGQYVIQLARLSGFETIVTNSSSQHHDHLKKLGATVTLDRKAASVADYANPAYSKSHKLAMIYDSIGSQESQVLAVKILQENSKRSPGSAQFFGLKKSSVVTVLMPEDPVKEANVNGVKDGAEEVDVKTAWGLSSAEYLRPQAIAFYRALGGEDGWLATKKYYPNRVTKINGGLAAINLALDESRAGVSGQKLIIRPFE